MSDDNSQLDSIPATGQALGIGRTKTYELLNSGALESVKIGKRRLVVRASRRRLVERLRNGQTIGAPLEINPEKSGDR